VVPAGAAAEVGGEPVEVGGVGHQDPGGAVAAEPVDEVGQFGLVVAGRHSGDQATSWPDAASWATTPTTTARVQRARIRTPKLSGKALGAPVSSSVPTTAAACSLARPSRLRYPSVPATSVNVVGCGSRRGDDGE